MKKETLEKRINNYQSSYLKKSDSPPARQGKSLYIREKYHERIFQIISIIGKRGVTLYDYVDNILTEHFEKYHEEIVNSFIDKRIF